MPHRHYYVALARRSYEIRVPVMKLINALSRWTSYSSACQYTTCVLLHRLGTLFSQPHTYKINLCAVRASHAIQQVKKPRTPYSEGTTIRLSEPMKKYRHKTSSTALCVKDRTTVRRNYCLADTGAGAGREWPTGDQRLVTAAAPSRRSVAWMIPEPVCIRT